MNVAATHRAAVCTALDGPRSVATQQVSDERLRPGSVRVAVRASGVNFPDYLLTRGEYQLKLEPPFIPGMEVAGVVTESAPPVNASPSWPIGTPVIAVMRTGGFAEQVVAPGDAVFALPPAFSYAEGATFLVAARTAYHALVERAAVESGETVLVLGATGGVGRAAVQLAKTLGANVIAIGSDDEKLAAVSAAGADHVVNYRRDDVVTSVRDLVKGVAVVFDPVGGDLATQAIRLLSWGGRYLVVGFASGTIPSFAANRLLLKGSSVLGVRAGEAARADPAAYHRSVATLLSFAAHGELRPHISHHFPLEATADALETLARRKVTGRVVIADGDPS